MSTLLVPFGRYKSIRVQSVVVAKIPDSPLDRRLMAAGPTDQIMKMTDVVGLINAANPAPSVRGPYKKQKAEISN
jgi:hypothetical protein